ncbi:hypothetical protein EKO04_008866 [Ascochyta lentis]|uniref:Uncharacterized protein n=1 Tax=Ascochyta lentis TaxID=205686 RepID=A0A8H7MFI5_9PLEO|nr:hypothetical protein EKO04_008866 [Ascochyta lentis]
MLNTDTTRLHHICWRDGWGTFHITKAALLRLRQYHHATHAPTAPSTRADSKQLRISNALTANSPQNNLPPRGAAAASVNRGTTAYTGARAYCTSARSYFDEHTPPHQAAKGYAPDLLPFKLMKSPRTLPRHTAKATWI